MIDIASEKLLTLDDAAKMLLVNKSTVFRWITNGSKGIKLDAIRLGSSWRTSEEALQRFADAGTPKQEVENPLSPQFRTPRQQQKHQEWVEQQLDDLMGSRRCENCREAIVAPKGSIPKGERVWCPKCLVQRKSATIGQRIRTFRWFQSMSQPNLAELAGVGIDLIRAFEHNEKYPTDAQLAKLTAVLGAELVSGLNMDKQQC